MQGFVLNPVTHRLWVSNLPDMGLWTFILSCWLRQEKPTEHV